MHPEADVHVDEPLVRGLLEQTPDYAGLPLRYAGHGWDNEIWRLGADLAVRLPRRAVADELLRNEVRWLPLLAPRLPLPTPAAVASGVPAGSYPYHWAVVPWLRGEPSTTRTPGERDEYAADLAGFFAALHVPAGTPDAPRNPVRGVPLASRTEAVEQRAAKRDDRDVLLAVWEDGLRAPSYDGDDVWLHGDPHPFNCLVDVRGELSAVVDFGDITVGDPASDVAVAWGHFTESGRRTFRDTLEVDDATWRRARAWAASYATSFGTLDKSHPLRGVATHISGALASSRE